MPKSKPRQSKTGYSIASAKAEGGIHFLEEFRQCLIGRTNAEDTSPRATEELMRKVVDAVHADGSIIEQLLAAPFPAKWSTPDLFYGWLSDVTHQLAWGTTRNELVGIIWAHTYQQATAEQKTSLRDRFVNDRDFFGPLYGLPAFLERTEIEAGELSRWLIAIRLRLGNNMAGGGFWNGLEKLAEKKASVALEIVEAWGSNSPDDNVLGMCGMLLGCVRGRNPQSCARIDQFFSEHPDVRRRLIYHHSWIAADGTRELDDEKYREVAKLMESGTQDERDAALNFIQATLPRTGRSDASFAFGINWLHENLPSDPSASWKHHLIRLAQATDDRCEAMNLRSLRERVPQLMPIGADHKGTFDALDDYLSHVLRKDFGTFLDLVSAIASNDKGRLASELKPHGEMHRLIEILRDGHSVHLAAAALDSLDFAVRHLGFSVFRHFGHGEIASETLNRWSANHLAILIFQFSLEALIEDSAARFLLIIAPRVEQLSPQLQELFVEEAEWQMRNLPGGCMEAIENGLKDVPCGLLETALKAAQSYFEKLRDCQRSPINSMGAEGLSRASRLLAKRRSQEMSKASEESSILTSLCSKSYTLYGGKKWQTYMGGRLGEINEMSEFSHSMEIPRLSTIDPDGYAQRRRHAVRVIAELEEKVRKERQGPQP